MKNVVIISGHHDLKSSLANKTVLEEISALCPQVEIRKLCELYPDYKFDIKAEQAALEKADVIIFQYPMNWYGVPGLLKLYIDKVMEHGWAYGSKGTALAGKALIASLTMGAPDVAYSAEGVMGQFRRNVQARLQEIILYRRHDVYTRCHDRRTKSCSYRQSQKARCQPRRLHKIFVRRLNVSRHHKKNSASRLRH